MHRLSYLDYKLAVLTIVGYNFTMHDFNWLSYHRMAEAFKFGFAQRMKLGDPEFSATVNQVFIVFKMRKNDLCARIVIYCIIWGLL